MNSSPISLEVLIEGTNVTKVSGEHFEGKTDLSIECLLINEQHTKYIPHKYMDLLPSLSTFVIRGSKLKYVTRNDFIGACGLKNLWLDGNEIESIASDTFMDIPHLETLFLHHNRLQAIGSDILTPFNRIITAYFKENPCIKTHFTTDPGYLKDSIPLSDLVTQIRENCLHDNNELSPSCNQLKDENNELKKTIARLEHNNTFLYKVISKYETDLMKCNSVQNFK